MNEIDLKCPDRIAIGDPDYFNGFKGSRLEELVADEKLKKSWSGMAVFENTVYEGIPLSYVKIIFSPKEHLTAYKNDVLFEGQTYEDKTLGTDSASYIISTLTGESHNEYLMHTGADGAYGVCRKIYSRHRKKKILDAVIFDLSVPNDMKDSIKSIIEKLFE